MAAALVDIQRISSLHIEQSQIIALLKNREGSIKQKINRWAEILQELINYADPDLADLTINQISTYIRGACRNHNMPIADNVDHYLPEKYKNPDKQNFLLEDRRITYGGIDPVLLIEELSHLPPDQIRKLSTSTKINLYDTIMKNKNLIESDAMENHYQLNDKHQRPAIRTPHPLSSRPTTLGNAYIQLGGTMVKFGNWVNTDFPPPEEYADRWIDGPWKMESMYNNIMNVKHTLTDKSWLQRDMYRIHQSKHGAAVKDKVETILCAKCSKLDREYYEPGDFVEMEYDPTSRTHWRCPDCRGVEGVKRGLTREQCGDKAIQSCPHCKTAIKWDQALSPIEARAIELIDGLEIWQELEEFYTTIPQKCIGARKVKLGVDLSSKA
jgi:hypothetical protein